MHDKLVQLREAVSLLFEDGTAGDLVDWEEAAAEMSVPSFPSDYQGFVAGFGAGSLEETLYVSIPRPGVVDAPLTVRRLPQHLLRAGAMSDWQEHGAASKYELRDMIVWGQTNSADTLCWLASDPAPDRWPVAVWERQGGGWKVHECSFSEFLLALLRGDFPACPVSDEALWGVQSARFLNLRDEERSLDMGVDPWSGRTLNRFD